MTNARATTAGDLLALIFSDTAEKKWPAVAIVVAHADDETIGVGGCLPKLRQNVHFVYLTDGAPRDMHDAWRTGYLGREDYAAARQRELATALALVGIDASCAVNLGAVDQEAVFFLDRLALQLVDWFERLAPEIVITHPYEGGHPDHDSTAFVVHAACQLLERRRGTAPTIVEMTSYHAGPCGICVGEFLPDSVSEILTISLSLGERQRKQAMLTCFRTQRETLAQFPVQLERFRLAPHYDFLRPPHAGRLYFEQFNWGIDAAQWGLLAAQAAAELGLCEAVSKCI